MYLKEGTLEILFASVLPFNDLVVMNVNASID